MIAAVVLGGLLVGGTVTWATPDSDEGTGPVAAPSDVTPSASGPVMKPVAYARLGTRAGGTLTRMDLAGPESGVRAGVWVWLPPQYDSPQYQDHRFPVLVAHSGYPGVGTNTMVDGEIGFLTKVADAVRRGTLPPVVVVAPELLPYDRAPTGAAAEADLDCSDIPGRPRQATFHTTDVRQAVLATFRVAAGRTAWALIGEGTGGLCATKYGLEHPQYWASAVSLSGRTTPRSQLWGTTADGTRARLANTPVTLLAGRPDVRLLLSTSSGDRAGRAENNRFASAAQAPTEVRTTATTSGTGATPADAARQLPAAFAFLGDNLVVPGQAPGPVASSPSPRATGRQVTTPPATASRATASRSTTPPATASRASRDTASSTRASSSTASPTG